MNQSNDLCRGSVLLIVVLILGGAISILGWVLLQDENQELQHLFAKTQAEWDFTRTCVQQRNAIVLLALRMLHRKPADTFAIRRQLREYDKREKNLLNAVALSQDAVAAERDLANRVAEMLHTLSNGPQVESKFEKLADLLAGAQNRLALQRVQYDRAARRLRDAMNSPGGSLAAYLFGVQEPVLWSP